MLSQKSYRLCCWNITATVYDWFQIIFVSTTNNWGVVPTSWDRLCWSSDGRNADNLQRKFLVNNQTLHSQLLINHILSALFVFTVAPQKHPHRWKSFKMFMNLFCACAAVLIDSNPFIYVHSFSDKLWQLPCQISCQSIT